MTQASRLVLVLLLAVAAGLFFWFQNSPAPATTGGQGKPAGQSGDAADLQGKGSVAQAGKPEEQRTSLAAKEGGDPAAAASSKRFSGRLRFADGSPAAGAEVRLWPVLEDADGGSLMITREMLRNRSSVPHVVSDAQGRFVIDPLQGRRFVRLQVSKGAMVEEPPQLDADQGPFALGDITVIRPARISGRALAQGVGAQGVEVRIGARRMSILGLGVNTDLSDAEGRFSLDEVKPGSWTLHTRSPGHLPASKQVEVTAGQHLEGVELLLETGLAVSGQVVDDLGRPVEGAAVGAARLQDRGTMKISSYQPAEQTTTDAAGNFVLAGLDPRKTQLRASKQGYGEAVLTDVAPGSKGLRLTIARQGSLTGRVIDDAGRAVAGSRVRVRRSGPGFMVVTEREDGVVTDAEGRFAIKAAPAGTHRLVVTGAGHLRRSMRVDIRAGEATPPVEVVVDRGSAVHCTVTGVDGQPVAGVEVRAHAYQPPQPGQQRRPRARSIRREVRRGPEGSEVIMGDSGQPLASARSDAEGVALLHGLAPGWIELRIRHDTLCLLEPMRLQVLADEESRVQLRVGPGGYIDLQVVDANKQAVPRAGFELSSDAELVAPIDDRVTAAGSKRIGPLPPGGYSAVLKRDPGLRVVGGSMSVRSADEDGDRLEQTTRRVAVQAGQVAQLQLRKPVLTRVFGTVQDSRGPVEGAVIELNPEGEPQIPGMARHRAVSDKDGKFEIRDLGPGAYDLRFKREGALVASEAKLELVADQAESRQDLQLPGGALSLQTLSQLGDKPIAQATVELARYVAPRSGEDQERRRPRQMMMVTMDVNATGPGNAAQTSSVQIGGAQSKKTDAEGRVRIPDVPAGKWTVTVKHGDFATTEQVVDIGKNQDKDLGTLRLQPGCVIRGSVSFAKPPRMPLAMVEIKAGDGSFRDRSVVQNGSFRFDGLKPGVYELRVRALLGRDNPYSEPRQIEAVIGRPQNVELQVPAK